ncbi:hypothetical protein COCON_G00163850 [Conger conger]|uniref:Uncharacterized protein n=1 Tax=Conger conger TaxID=82655 RepID=A0A9Q1D6A6_CONCO|nr:hypothetical protein COCON_G00163850 [Conger conger]
MCPGSISVPDTGFESIPNVLDRGTAMRPLMGVKSSGDKRPTPYSQADNSSRPEISPFPQQNRHCEDVNKHNELLLTGCFLIFTPDRDCCA